MSNFGLLPIAMIYGQTYGCILFRHAGFSNFGMNVKPFEIREIDIKRAWLRQNLLQIKILIIFFN